jgi:hypothetical protein
MNLPIIILKTDFELNNLENVGNLNSRQMVEKMLKEGYEYFILIDPQIEKLADTVFLPIENDLEFFIESYLYLEELIAAEKNFFHNTFLGDGVLEIKAIVTENNVNLIYKYCPQLNRANLVMYEIKTTQQKLLIWWRNAAYKLAQLGGNS